MLTFPVAHSSDLPYLFGRASVANNWTQAEEDAAHRMLTYWINFAHDLDPNGKSGKHGHKGDKNKDNKAPYWPAHTYPANKNMLRMHVERFEVVQDDYREDQMKVWDVPGMAEALHYRRRRGGGSGAGWE
jgi:carboxylesterase type B